MAIIENNIWSLYKAIVAIGLLLMSALLYFRWETIYDRYENYHQNRVKLSSQALDSILSSQEIMLEVIGYELIRTTDGLSSLEPEIIESGEKLLDSALELDPSLVGLSLVWPDGSPIISTVQTPRTSLTQRPQTKDTFQLTLESQHMVVGRTYFSNTIDEWIVPIRTALRDSDGSVAAVMTGGLRLANNGLFDGLNAESDYDNYIVYREFDRYIQFYARMGVVIEEYTQAPRTEQQAEEGQREFERQLGRSITSIKESEETFNLSVFRDGNSYITSTRFNKRYQLWTVSEVSFTPLYREFFTLALVYCLILSAMMTLLFKWFSMIDNAEKRRIEELFRLSRIDELTGLANKTALLDVILPMLRHQQPFFLSVVNINNFRRINDQHGLEMGDLCLIAFANRLEILAQDKTNLFRVSGDEFAIIYPHTIEEKIKEQNQALAEQLHAPVNVNNIKLRMSACIGTVYSPTHGTGLDELTRKAHLAIYHAKATSNSAFLYQDKLEQPFLRQVRLEERLKLALEIKRSLFMCYQPQVDSNGKTESLEALVRWTDDELGAVSPLEFVNVAEKSGLMNELGSFVIDTSLKEFKEICSKTKAPLKLAINISVIQFKDPSFVNEVIHTLQKHDLQAKRLILEITESLFMDDFEFVINAIMQLREAGIAISMDDFGTGYSSLSLLRKLPLDELKIDKGFIDGLPDDKKACSMIESIVSIAQSCELEVVAEGVETSAQLDVLVSMTCEKFQGFYFAKPMTSKQVVEYIGNR